MKKLFTILVASLLAVGTFIGCKQNIDSIAPSVSEAPIYYKSKYVGSSDLVEIYI